MSDMNEAVNFATEEAAVKYVVTVLENCTLYEEADDIVIVL